MRYRKSLRNIAVALTLAMGFFGMHPAAIGGQLSLSWTDNSSNEDGFNIERRAGTSGAYAQLANIAANTTSYTDGNLQNGTAYCYRVRAYNAAGPSGYSNEQCITVSLLPADTAPPVRSNGAPTGVLTAGTTQATLSLATDENASCRYATAAGGAYASMSKAFTATGETAHSATVSGLADGVSYNYFVRCQDTAGNANTDDFIIGFSVASPAAQTTYQASIDFSSTQGFRNWYYLYGSGIEMTYVGSRWQGNETYLWLSANNGHPGNQSDAVRRWKAPQPGSINIAGAAFDRDTSCGSGVSVYIKKNSTILWQQAIANGNTAGVSYNLATTVAAGDNIDFGINRGGADNYCDSTGFDPIIVFTSSVPPSADTTPPVLSNGSPKGTLAAGTTRTTLSLTTNENASCRYATAAGVAYGSMPSVFSTTGGSAHSATVSGLSNGGSYSYFVRCQDTSNNVNASDYSIGFSVAPTSFTLTVSKGGSGSGTVTAMGINCGADCSEPYAAGTSVTLTAVAASGSTFAGWSGTGCSTGTVVVNGDMACAATFNKAITVDGSQLILTWTDNSTNEDGFSIERRVGTIGSYAQLANVAANTTSYTDGNLQSSTTYCYRVRAYNAAGPSGYSNENCATTTGPATGYTLTVSKSGSGSGTVTAAGINCGADCSEPYAAGTSVTLTAVAASGSAFAGWSGTGCDTGTVAVNGNMTCTATFNPTTYALTVNVAGEITTIGSAGGRVTSNPGGIDCETDCDESYQTGRIVALTAIANANSVFKGWTGDSDCADGSVTMNAHKICTANFALNLVSLTVSKSGSGTVSSAPGGIDCGAACSYNYLAGDTVVLRATPAAGFIFAGWSGGGCSGTPDCSVKLTVATRVTATFVNDRIDKVGVYRPSTGEWFLDQNGNGMFDGCQIDICVQTFSAAGAVPVVGDWNGSGFTQLGLFLPGTSQWQVDINGDRTWSGCGVDKCLGSFGSSSDFPFAGQWTQSASDRIATFRPSNGTWYIDASGDGSLDCRKDYCLSLRNFKDGDLPVVGDWTGDGLSKLGLYRPASGEWFLDRNGNRSWSGCSKDTCISDFGTAQDLPVTGDWSGTGTGKIGVFRPATGEWMLDLNGNGRWDGCSVDLCLSGFGGPGDVPVIGRW